jgi:hypothetical protein
VLNWKTVKDVSLAEVDILSVKVASFSVKVASLYGIIRKQTVNDTKWSHVVDGKHKKFSFTSQVKQKRLKPTCSVGFLVYSVGSFM